jgi:hypothetical protein
MQRVLLRWKVLFFLVVLFLLFGCSYNAAYTRQLSPRGGVDCSKFASEYNDAERKICQAKD